MPLSKVLLQMEEIYSKRERRVERRDQFAVPSRGFYSVVGSLLQEGKPVRLSGRFGDAVACAAPHTRQQVQFVAAPPASLRAGVQIQPIRRANILSDRDEAVTPAERTANGKNPPTDAAARAGAERCSQCVRYRRIARAVAVQQWKEARRADPAASEGMAREGSNRCAGAAAQKRQRRSKTRRYHGKSSAR